MIQILFLQLLNENQTRSVCRNFSPKNSSQKSMHLSQLKAKQLFPSKTLLHHSQQALRFRSRSKTLRYRTSSSPQDLTKSIWKHAKSWPTPTQKISLTRSPSRLRSTTLFEIETLMEPKIALSLLPIKSLSLKSRETSKCTFKPTDHLTWPSSTMLDLSLQTRIPRICQTLSECLWWISRKWTNRKDTSA